MSTKISLYTSGRTGSQFVYELLKANLNGLELVEWLSPSFKRTDDSITNKKFLAYLCDRMLRNPDDFAIKITPHMFQDFWDDARDQIEEVLCATKATKQILMYRDDFWGLCVSDWIANKTGKWHSNQAPQEGRDVSFEKVARSMFRSESLIFDCFLDHASTNAMIISYESLLSSPVTFSHSLLRKITSTNPSFSSFRAKSLTKRVLQPETEGYLDLIQSIPEAELDLFYDLKDARDKALVSRLSKFYAIAN